MHLYLYTCLKVCLHVSADIIICVCVLSVEAEKVVPGGAVKNSLLDQDCAGDRRLLPPPVSKLHTKTDERLSARL